MQSSNITETGGGVRSIPNPYEISTSTYVKNHIAQSEVKNFVDPDEEISRIRNETEAVVEAEKQQISAKNTKKTGKNEKEPTKTELLIEIALRHAELFHDADDKSYATIKINDGYATYPLRNKGFKSWLSSKFWKMYREGIGSQITQDAIDTLEAHAIHEGPCEPVYVRVAGYKGNVYVDLGNDDFEIIEITRNGWQVLKNKKEIRFKRPQGFLPLPYPSNKGNIGILKNFINLEDDSNFPLVIAFLLGCYHPSGPYPILDTEGEQGTSKSTVQRAIKKLIDPNTAELRSGPKDIRDLAIAGFNSWLLGFDNLSNIPDWLSDALCRMSTGGGFSTRTLYSDDEETVFDMRRPLMVNGITNVIRRHDLADRAIRIELGIILEEKRKPEKQFWEEFDAAAPEILAGIFDGISCALDHLESIRIQQFPRMADFFKWISAAEPAMPWPIGTFAEAYQRNRAEIIEETVDGDVVAMAVKSLMESRSKWEGTATELLKILNSLVDDQIVKSKFWPKAGNSLSGRLKRSATALRSQGIDIQFPRRTRSGQKIIINRIVTNK